MEINLFQVNLIFLNKIFKNIKKTINKTTSYLNSGVLVSTKNDLKSAKVVDLTEGKNLAQKFGVEFYEVSSARNIDIEQHFNYLAEIALQVGHN